MADSRQASTSGTASIDTLSPDERISKAAAEDPEYAAALRRQRERELEQEKLYCSLENKEACLMCSGWGRLGKLCNFCYDIMDELDATVIEEINLEYIFHVPYYCVNHLDNWQMVSTLSRLRSAV